MNRHGISQNPTQEEVALLRKLWRGDAARSRAQHLSAENEELRNTIARERAEAIRDYLDSEAAVSELAAALYDLYWSFFDNREDHAAAMDRANSLLDKPESER